MVPMMVEAEPMGGTAAISQPTKFWPKMWLAIYPQNLSSCMNSSSSIASTPLIRSRIPCFFHFAHSILSQQIALYNKTMFYKFAKRKHLTIKGLTDKHSKGRKHTRLSPGFFEAWLRLLQMFVTTLDPESAGPAEVFSG